MTRYKKHYEEACFIDTPKPNDTPKPKQLTCLDSFFRGDINETRELYWTKLGHETAINIHDGYQALEWDSPNGDITFLYVLDDGTISVTRCK